MKKRKGLTLIELIVTMAITALLLGVIGNALVTNLKFFYKSSFENDAQLSSQNIHASLKNAITSGGNKEIRLYNAMPAEADYKLNHTYIYFENGFLKVVETNKNLDDPLAPVNVEAEYDLMLYGGDEYDIKFTTVANNPFIINVHIEIDGGSQGSYNYENMIVLRRNISTILNPTPADPNIVTEGTVLVIEEILAKVVIE